MTSPVKLYGISNCDTINKAKVWLNKRAIDFEFHDTRKQGLEIEILLSWIDSLGWETLLNRRGTTWRQLADETKKSMNREIAIQVMLDNPAIIKRPLLVEQGRYHLGFNETQYDEIFN